MRMRSTPVRLVVAAALALCLVTATGPSVRAAGYGCGCDMTQGFHYSSGGTSTVGYLVSATIAGTTLTPDIEVYDPGTGASGLVVGVISTDAWAGGTGDAISLTAYVSSANRQRLQTLLQKALPTTAVSFDFANYAWDASGKRYFESFGPVSPPLRGQLAHSANGAPALQVASTPGPVQSPQNYAMTMSVVPGSGGAQSIRVAGSSTASQVKPWGISP
jgi:hypothetical protein